jgi:hypothetical protein
LQKYDEKSEGDFIQKDAETKIAFVGVFAFLDWLDWHNNGISCIDANYYFPVSSKRNASSNILV